MSLTKQEFMAALADTFNIESVAAMVAAMNASDGGDASAAQTLAKQSIASDASNDEAVLLLAEIDSILAEQTLIAQPVPVQTALGLAAQSIKLLDQWSIAPHKMWPKWPVSVDRTQRADSIRARAQKVCDAYPLADVAAAFGNAVTGEPKSNAGLYIVGTLVLIGGALWLRSRKRA